MEFALDPYEQKLFQMFKSYDITNSGLDETALIKLCNSLDLSDQSNIIVKSLLKRNNQDSTVDFKSFKEALLNFLGTEMESASQDEKTLNLTNDGGGKKENISITPDSPTREVSPKLVMGAKKYGRRSRPQSIATDSSLSETDEENIQCQRTNGVQRSCSHSDMHNSNGNRNRRRPANITTTKLKRCASLPVQKRNFHAKSYAKEQQQNQLHQQIKHLPTVENKNIENEQKQLTSSVESLGNIDFENLSHTINDIWSSYTNEPKSNNTKCLNRGQLESLCERIGLFHNVAGKMADEVFEKLNLNPKVDAISFNEFITLLHGADTDDFASANETLESSSFFNNQKIYENNTLNDINKKNIIINNNYSNENNKNNNSDNNDDSSVSSRASFKFCFNSLEVHKNTQDSLSTLVDTTANNQEFNVQDIPIQLETIPSKSVIDMWKNASLKKPKTLLVNLGFEDDVVNVSQLIKVLDEELRGLQHSETQTTLLKALLAIEKAEVISLQQTVKQLCEENKKLHADNKDANKRATLLAQEIDERHANLEDSTKTELKLLEQRHAEIVKDLTMQISADRENWSNLNSRLESRIIYLEQEEQRLKSDIITLQHENSALDSDQSSLQKQVTDLLENNIKLNNEIMHLSEKNVFDVEGLKESDEILELMGKIAALQIENTHLRDKNDELTVELENINMELVKLKMSSKKSNRSPVNDSTNEILSEEAEQASSLAIKRRGDSPSKAKLTEESPRTGKLRKCHNDESNNSESDTSGDWVALNAELNAITPTTATTSTSGFSQDYSSLNTNDDARNDEIKVMKEKISKLEQELNDMQGKNKLLLSERDLNDEKLVEEKNNVEIRCKELETSLEQMRKAYEDCEDYWQNKINDERQIFEKERQIYEDEQNESDKKFAELMDKVREYEEQYSKDGRLSPILEKDTLEQQYMELEAELEEIRYNANKIFEEKTKEIEDLKMNVQELKLRLGDSVDITQVCMENIKITSEKTGEVESPASSPISYLWNQSTIQAPARDYQNPNWNKKNTGEASRIENLTTSETSIFSIPVNESENLSAEKAEKSNSENKPINPIQKPISTSGSLKSNKSDRDTEDSSSTTSSSKSYETHSVLSSHSLHKSTVLNLSGHSSPNGIKEELKRLKFFEIQLREQIKDLALKRDSLVMELQQLQEAKPVLEKAYARAAHPTLIQRVNLLEQKNRLLQNQLRQQQQYTDSILQQTWQQQRNEVAELRNRIETQGMHMADQIQRLTNADMLVKDLYVENSHLSATIQEFEAQRSRANLLQHQLQHKQTSGFGGLSGMP